MNGVKIVGHLNMPGRIAASASSLYAKNLYAFLEILVDKKEKALAVKWDDGSESFVRLETLRRHCPCAGCKGEVDVMGNLYKNPRKPLPSSAFELRRIAQVGGYAIQPIWGDGHATGLYSFEYLRKVAQGAGGGAG